MFFARVAKACVGRLFPVDKLLVSYGYVWFRKNRQYPVFKGLVFGIVLGVIGAKEGLHIMERVARTDDQYVFVRETLQDFTNTNVFGGIETFLQRNLQGWNVGLWMQQQTWNKHTVIQPAAAVEIGSNARSVELLF